MFTQEDCMVIRVQILWCKPACACQSFKLDKIKEGRKDDQKVEREGRNTKPGRMEGKKEGKSEEKEGR